MASHGGSLMGLMGSVVRSAVALAGRIVSFTGRFDVNFLEKGDNSTQTVANEQKPTPALTHEAKKARDRLRNAISLQRQQSEGRAQFKRFEWALLKDLADGKLHTAANDATRKSGYGRIKNQDGTVEDIARHGGGIVRRVLDNADPSSSGDKVLDNADPSSSGDEFLDVIEPDDDDVPCWGSPSTTM